jgi:hypothetical protein
MFLGDTFCAFWKGFRGERYGEVSTYKTRRPTHLGSQFHIILYCSFVKKHHHIWKESTNEMNFWCFRHRVHILFTIESFWIVMLFQANEWYFQCKDLNGTHNPCATALATDFEGNTKGMGKTYIDLVTRFSAKKDHFLPKSRHHDMVVQVLKLC